MKTIKIILTMLLAVVASGSMAQGIIIYKSNGTQEKLPYTAVDSIIPYFADKKPEPVAAKPVDLGLPSGTLWASHNVGASAPQELGGYYAFGELDEKATYTWSSYICGENECGTSTDPMFEDGILQLTVTYGVKIYSGNIAGTKYDVATQLWDDSWVMPTYEQYQELFENCTAEFVWINGVSCKELKGPNGNTVVFPLYGGYKVDLETKYASSYSYTSYLWTDQYYRDGKEAYYANLTNSNQTVSSYSCQSRKCGLQVRPVKKK